MDELLPTTALKPNRPDVIDETFDGEAVLVNLDSGCYFALTPSATEIWRLFADGRTAAEVMESVDGDSDAIGRFIHLLVDETLLVEGSASVGAVTDRIVLGGEIEAQKFTDMQDLLALDPIHDIDLDADGWPVAPPV